MVTGDIFDGDAKIMTSGYEKRDFFSVSSAIGPLGVGEKATGFLLMKWDDNWISKQHGVGSCQLQLQFWGQQNEYHPDKGDRLFTIEIPDPHPNEPDKPPPDPNAPFVPQPVVHKTSNTVIFGSLSYAGVSIDIYPGCGPGGDFLHWPELSAKIFVNGQETDLLPTSNEVGIVQCRDLKVRDGVTVALTWRVANGGFAGVGNHPGSISEVTISGPGIAGNVIVSLEGTQVIAQTRGVITVGEISPPINLSSMKVVEAVKPFIMNIRGQCGQVRACAVLLSDRALRNVAAFGNWGQNQSVGPQMTYWPLSVDELVGIVQQAEKRGENVRAVGSGWSYSDIAITHDHHVRTGEAKWPLNRTLGWQGGPQLPNCPPIMRDALAGAASGRKLYHVEAGITIRELYARLDNQHGESGLLAETRDALAAANRTHDSPFNCAQVDAIPEILALDWSHDRWALPTMGGSGGQTLAGAISTSVHGGDFNLAPLPDMVQAIHLVGPGGKQYWIERRVPITDRQRLAAILTNVDERNIIYDDDWFNSVLVSMGCMGIIYSFVIEVEDQYGLEEVRAKSTWNTVRPLLADGTLFAPPLPAWLAANRKDNNQAFTPRFLEIAINMYPEDNKDHVCFVRSRSKISNIDGLQPPPPPTGLDQNDINLIILHEDDPILNRGIQEGWSSLHGGGSEALGKVVNAAEEHNNVKLVHDLTENVLEQWYLDASRLNVRALSYQVMDTYDYSTPLRDQLRVLGLEIAIDASDNSYLNHIDWLLDKVANVEIPNRKFVAGLFSIRLTGASHAYLAMQQTNRTCHIEMDLLTTADSTWDVLNQFAGFGNQRLHWGLNPTQLSSQLGYPNQQKWKQVWAELTNNGSAHTFNNDFSKRFGLTP